MLKVYLLVPDSSVVAVIVAAGGLLHAVRALSVQKYRTPGLRGDMMALCSVVSTEGAFLAPVTVA